MSDALLGYYNLHSHPFSKEVPTHNLLMLESFKPYMQQLHVLVHMRGIGVMTGKSGTGKSSLIRKMCDELNPGIYKPLYICHTSVSLNEFYYHIASALGLQPPARKAKMFKSIKERLWQLHSSHKVHPILFIDEAHLLRTEILADLRLLLNFEIDSVNACTVLLCGGQQLPLKFSLSALEPLANSITMSIEIECLKEEETFAYIENRCKAAGNSQPLFTKNALRTIHQSSGGNLRVINNIAFASLSKAYMMSSQTVEAEHVKLVLSR
jgi:type II secretory pathway predicted ATPase ExeA